MSVMRDGRMIGTVERADTDQRRLAGMMVGREVILRVDKTEADPKETRLEVTDLQVESEHGAGLAVDGGSLQVRAGEILGIAGIEGNGQPELVECITSLLPAAGGTVLLDGVEVTAASVRARRQRGLSHIPEARYERGLAPPFTAAMHSVLGDHSRPPYASRAGILDEAAINSHADRIIEDYDVRPRSRDVQASSYSGGNAQKLIVARELERPLRLLIAAQPDRKSTRLNSSHVAITYA